MANAWMIRAGESGYLFDQFRQGFVAVGWSDIGDLSSCKDAEAIRSRYLDAYPDQKPGEVRNGVAVLAKFRFEVAIGDNVITYSPARREYLVGQITIEYLYDEKQIPGYPHLRKVQWGKPINRDSLRPASRNSLGSALTLFSLSDDVWEDVQAAQQRSGQAPQEPLEEEKEEIKLTKEDTAQRSHELIKDKVTRLTEDEVEELVAALLRGMGYRARVTPKGPDRGVDVLASPDGLGLEQPRIKAEVKHRPKSTMGAQEIRSFLGGMREGDRGIYVSTGGFTKDARYEADRANVPCTLLDLDDLVRLVVQHYESFDVDGRSLLSLVRIYWPAE